MSTPFFFGFKKTAHAICISYVIEMKGGEEKIKAMKKVESLPPNKKYAKL